MMDPKVKFDNNAAVLTDDKGRQWEQEYLDLLQEELNRGQMKIILH